MKSLLGLAQEHLARVFEDKSSPGTAIVLATKGIDRIHLLAWLMDDFVGDPDPQDPARVLYVCAQPDIVKQTCAALRDLRHQATGAPVNDCVVPDRTAHLPKLREFSYVKLRTLHRVAGEMRPHWLDLLVLDERHRGEMKSMTGFVARVQPLVTVVITGHDLSHDNPWSHFGAPLVLHDAL